MLKSDARRADRRQRAVGRRGIRSLARDDDGATVVEYALVLALIVGGLMLAADVLRPVATFDGVAAVLHDVEGAAAAAENKPAAAPPTASPRRGAQLSWPTLLVLVALPALCLGWGLYQRFRRGGPLPDEPAAAAASEAALPDRLFTKRQALLRLFTDNLAALLERDLLVKHLMSPHLERIEPGEQLAEVRRRMIDKRIRHLLVCSGDGRLRGILSDRDVNARSGKTVADVMTRDPLTVSPDAPVNPAVTLMIARSISCLPVVADGRVCGILTTTDLLLALQCNLQLLQRVAHMLRLDSNDAAAECDDRGCPVGAA